MNVSRTATALLVLAVGAGACGTRDSSDEPAEEVATTPSTSPATGTDQEDGGATIPDGTYTKVVTMPDADRLGLSRDTALEFLGEDGELNVELTIDGDDYAQFSDDGDAPLTQGDGGTAAYDEAGNWVITSDSSGCPGCVTTWAWSLEGPVLSLEMIETTEAGDPENVLISRLVFEGEFTSR